MQPAVQSVRGIKCLPERRNIIELGCWLLTIEPGKIVIWALGSDMRNVLRLIVEAILENDVDFGYLRSFIRNPQMTEFDFGTIMDLAETNINVLDNNVEIVDFNLLAMRNCISVERLMITLLALGNAP